MAGNNVFSVKEGIRHRNALWKELKENVLS